MNKYFILLTFGLFYISDANAMFCHVCLNLTDTANNFCDPLHKPSQTKVKPCPELNETDFLLGVRPICYKTVKIVQSSENTTKLIDRGCALGGGYHEFCTEFLKENPEGSTCMWCNRDECTSLDCYVCDGDDKCEWKKNSSLSTNTCPDITEAKKKVGVKAKCYRIEKAGTYKRGCTEDEGDKKFCEEEKGKDAKIDCFVCEKNLCNDNGATNSVVNNAKNDMKNTTSTDDKGAVGNISVNFYGFLALIVAVIAYNRIFA
ncbi:hypothetical protein PVAND_012495 [Polypedilum vanderplanki]|uniref:DUF753 domain-containing protein n=1 Tax=Polypedilum vanderplanki TaxID=319348 RepID=A0A9J6CMW6_POLVA|nr:hypothetical protein PVAND_012495 [Polypedilum vanderplanki]